MTKNKAFKIIKNLSIAVFIFCFALLLAANIAYLSSKYVRTYIHFPNDVKTESIGLSLSVVRNYIIPYTLDTEKAKEVKREDLAHTVKLGGDWLLRMQENQGRFNYWYHPTRDELSQPHDDNFLRQAGTCYSLCVSAQATGDSNYLNAAKQSMNYLMRQKRDLDDDKSYFMFRSKAKLGGIALPMLGMLKLKELTGTTEFDVELKKLANMILYLQDAYGTGQFKSTYIYRGDMNYDWHSDIYPGEALYALSEMYDTFGDEIYKESFDYAAKFYDDSKYWGRSAFMPWTISALSKMFILTKDEYYLSYAKKITDRMILTQNLNPNSKEYGSWNPIPMVNSSTCMEALGDLVHALSYSEDKVALEKYKTHSLIGYRWLMKLQFTEDELEGIARPQFALGGFPASDFDNKIRIDNTQHSITALAKGMMYIF